MKLSVLFSSLTVCLSVSVISQSAVAETNRSSDAPLNYPTKPITIVVPYAPGGGVDTMSRLVGSKLESRIGQRVIIDNRPGGSTTIGMNHAILSNPDGYTLFMATTPTVVNPSLRKLRYDPQDGLVPISLIATYPTLLVTHPSVPVNNVQELIDYARANPGELNYASVGAGSSTHLAAEMFKSMADLDIAHIPYNGSAPAITDLLSGRVQLMFSTMLAGLPHAQANQLKALAVTTPERSPSVPDLPTVAESGLDGFDVTSFYALMSPAETPENIRNFLNEEIIDIMKDPELEKQLIKDGVRVVAATPEESKRFFDTQYGLWPKVIKAANISIE